MDIEHMNLLYELYQNSTVAKTVDYEHFNEQVFFNKEAFIREADKLIQEYTIKIKK